MKITINELIEAAKPYNLCDKLDGVDNWTKLIKVLLTAQGSEFCENTKFLSLEQFRNLDCNASDYGVYVDAGSIALDNCKNIVIVGNTDAEINITENKRITKIMAMHGAQITVNASNYAVILIVNIDSEVVINKDETTVIL